MIAEMLLIAPVVLPLATAALTVLSFRWTFMRQVLGIGGTALLTAVCAALFALVLRDGIQTVTLGDWPAPFGITFTADLFGAAMVLAAALVALCVAIYGIEGIGAHGRHGEFWPFLHVLMMGVSGAFLTGDIFNLFVWFEVTLMTSFVLLIVGGTPEQLQGAVKYLALNMLSSLLFLAAVGMLYGMTGSLNMASLARTLQDYPRPEQFTPLAMLFLTAFGIKAALFPLFFWLPASYHTPPISIAALFAALLTKVGIYAIIRVFTLLFVVEGFSQTALLLVAGFTMAVGALGALVQNDLRRMLSYLVIGEMGYLVMGLGIGSRLALAGAAYFMFQMILAKCGIFLLAGILCTRGGGYDLRRLGGLYAARPYTAVLFLVMALSIAGIPPFSGFWGKFALVRGGLEAEQWVITAVALTAGFIMLFAMARAWAEIFWKQPEDIEGVECSAPVGWRLYAPTAACGLAVVALGIFAGPAFDVALRAADELRAPQDYVQAVLGSSP